MNRIQTLLVLLVVTAAVGFIHAQAPAAAKPEKLFNGKNLDGWRYYLADHAAGLDDVWSVKDGVIVCKGEPMGYLWTKKAYKNCRVSLEYRWPTGVKPTNSGVFTRINGKPMPLPRCFETQLQHGKAGDLFGFQGMKLSGEQARLRQVKDHELGGDLTGVSRAVGAEKEPGEWNRVEILLDGPRIKVWMNGQLVNEANDAEVVTGPIALQSEGGEVHFRNVEVIALPD